MNISFTIIAGAEKGTTLSAPITERPVIVGRSSEAEIRLNDQKVSRCHLGLRVSHGGLLAKNLSARGFLHNDQAYAGAGEIQLEHGDEISLGSTTLRLQAEPMVAPEAVAEGQSASPPSTEEETRAADATIAVGPSDDSVPENGRREDDSSATRPFVEQEEPPILAAADLPAAKAPVQATRPRRALVWSLLVSMLLLLTAGLAVRGPLENAGREGTTEFRHPLNGFSVQYPAPWVELGSGANAVTFGFGRKSSAEWGRVNLISERGPEFAELGRTLAFDQYCRTLERQFSGFRLRGQEHFRINNVALIHFCFSTPDVEGDGAFVLNGETRAVIECYGPQGQYGRRRDEFLNVLSSFRLTGAEAQQFFDFPLPDETLRRTAMVDPAGLSRRIVELARQAEDLMANPKVRPENLYRSVQAYRRAMQGQLALSAAGQPAPVRLLGQKLREASTTYNRAIATEEFEIERAMKLGRAEAAWTATLKLIQMVPDKADPIRQQVEKITHNLRPKEHI